MKRMLALATLAPLVLATVAADAEPAAPAPAPACDREAGRESLGLDGLQLEMLAPGVAAPELIATHEATGDLVTPYRSATFPMILDVAPYAAARIELSLSWEHPNDYDLYLFAEQDGFEYEAAKSNGSNIDEQTSSEQMSVTLDDCTPLRIEARNWAGSPAETLALDVTVTPVGDPATDVLAREDTRTALYLAGDRPGQLGTYKHGSLGAEQIPVTTAFSEERPDDNTPNSNTRALIGTEIERNPFQPFWYGEFGADGGTLDGQASAVVWLSSQTQQHDPGVVKLSLFVNGAESSVELPGELIGRDPAPFFVTFPDVFDHTPLWSLTFQATSLPQVSPNTPSDKRGDAQHTVLYDSLQFQSAVYLPTTG